MAQRTSRRTNPEGRMSLASHLKELRRRFILVAVGLLAGSILGWYLSDPVYDAIQQPIQLLQDTRGIDARMVFPEMTTALNIKVRVSLMVALLVSSPWWMFQVWAFINPGLTRREKRYALGFVGAGVPLFLGGSAMAWIALPNTIRLLAQFIPEGDSAAGFFNVDVYLRFVINFILVFGFAFLLPLVMVALTFLGVVRGITWLRGWRWAVIIIFVLSALATPTAEPVTFILMAIPIIILYFMALGVCILRDRARDRKRAKAEAAELGNPGPGDGGDDNGQHDGGTDPSPTTPSAPAPASPEQITAGAREPVEGGADALPPVPARADREDAPDSQVVVADSEVTDGPAAEDHVDSPEEVPDAAVSRSSEVRPASSSLSR